MTETKLTSFSGSYDPSDVTFLLKPVVLEPTPIATKERLIQSGQKHYSEMISREQLPSKAYLDVFYDAVARNQARFAQDLLSLAGAVAQQQRGDVVIVSLARAGTPVGVLLTRLLRRHFKRDTKHYSVSIIRDRGIDAVALGHVLSHHPQDQVVFVDGWTGKGVIARELSRWVGVFNDRHGTDLPRGLWAVADLCGAAAVAASRDDYLIPSAILNSTVSGLVSRSILNDAVVGPGEFHGCLYLDAFRDHDLSRWFVDTVDALAAELAAQSDPQPDTVPDTAPDDAARSRAFLDRMARDEGVTDPNHVKPGIGEATRVLLRRVPDLLLLRDPDDPDVAHLRVLADEKGVPIRPDPALPYRAAALIKRLEPTPRPPDAPQGMTDA
ncbi:MAG: tellurite-like stress resistance cysteine protease StiP [Trueperaceae bacterium]|nr:tellurite-like stress resistance cysteine protease StiP [Trueperaceae bacterium]